MGRIARPIDVQYLALQGGGGKGFAYIGAIEALENLGVLPKKVGVGGTLRGVSGTSVGGILALLLSIGCTSKDLLDIFKSNYEFLKFFDGPDAGLARAIKSDDWSATKSVRDATVVRGVEAAQRGVSKAVGLLGELSDSADIFNRLGITSSKWNGATLFAIWLALSPIGQAERDLSKLTQEFPFIKPIISNPISYASNLLYDRGLFPGFAVRDFLRKIVKQYLPRHPRWKRQIPDPSTITFAQLRDTTDLDLCVVGTNLSQRRSVYFSAKHTPGFRVVEAVGISACFPVIFKPIWIEASKSDPVLGGLTGYWVDGGLLNNIPLHAFDTQTNVRNANILNPNVLALALHPGAPQSYDYPAPSESDPLANLALDMLETVLMPSGPGQYATQAERDQVIEIFSYSLSLFDFAPSESASRAPRKSAFDAVVDYFARR